MRETWEDYTAAELCLNIMNQSKIDSIILLGGY